MIMILDSDLGVELLAFSPLLIILLLLGGLVAARKLNSGITFLMGSMPRVDAAIGKI